MVCPVKIVQAKFIACEIKTDLSLFNVMSMYENIEMLNREKLNTFKFKMGGMEKNSDLKIYIFNAWKRKRDMRVEISIKL